MQPPENQGVVRRTKRQVLQKIQRSTSELYCGLNFLKIIRVWWTSPKRIVLPFPQKSKFFNMMMALKTELASTGDPRSEDMEAIRELAAERWEKMTPEEKDHFKS